LTDKEIKLDNVIALEENMPMIFGKEKDRGLILDGTQFRVVSLEKDYSKSDIIVHNPKDRNLGLILSEMTYDEDLPVPIGMFSLYKIPIGTGKTSSYVISLSINPKFLSLGL
jgi:2-oxoglutarate ferredoxin oxidoreductase subunit beta